MPTTNDEVPFDKNVANVVRVLMTIRQLDAHDVADQLGIAHSTFYEKLKGKTWKGVELGGMADIFKVPPGVFFEDVNDLLASSKPWITARDKSITQMSLLDAIAV